MSKQVLQWPKLAIPIGLPISNWLRWCRSLAYPQDALFPIREAISHWLSLHPEAETGFFEWVIKQLCVLFGLRRSILVERISAFALVAVGFVEDGDVMVGFVAWRIEGWTGDKRSVFLCCCRIWIWGLIIPILWQLSLLEGNPSFLSFTKNTHSNISSAP